MTTLRGRLLGSFLVLGLTVLIGLGAVLFVVLRELHRDANSAALADVATQLVAQARLRGDGEPPARRALEALRDSPLREGTALLLVDESGRVIAALGAARQVSDFPDRIDLVPERRRGDVRRGSLEIPGLGSHVYVAATLAGERAARGPRALVLARPDDSATRALADLGRAVGAAAILLLLVAAPIGVWLARSVTRPLERLAAATAVLGRGDLPPPLSTEGPAEVARASASFNAMISEVAASRRAQSELFANLRHDLRTPLTVIGGFAQALLDGTAKGRRETRRAAEAIAVETARLERLLSDLGDLTDIEAGQRPLRVEQLDAAQLAREAATRFAGLAAANGQTVEAQAADGPLPLLGDRTALGRILDNLVRNALAAAARPGGHVWIEPATLADGHVRLAVRDDGPGIPQAALPRLFQRFFTGDPARSGNGSGLGLTIVEQLARAHGGSVFAENLARGGARVGVLLPLTPRPRP
jgi:signal transduction histidine kinase